MDATEQESVAAEAPVARLEFGVEWPPRHVAAYVIEAPEPILVDAGPPDDGDLPLLDDELARIGYEPANLTAAVVTHPHSDHIGQVPRLREAGVPVYAPEAALEQLRRDADDLAAGVREVGRSIGLAEGDRLDDQVDRAVHSLERDRRLLDPGETTGIPFGEPVEIAGRTFDVVHTPGHQINHGSLLTTVGDERALFSGDTLIGSFRAAALHVGMDYGAYDAIDAFYESMDRFEAHHADRVYPGHGSVFEDYYPAIERTRSKLDAVVSETLDATAEIGPATPIEIVTERVGEIEHPAALLDVLGALGTLEDRGQVAYELDDGVRYYDAV